jgi:hypothetical protein
MRVGNEQAFGVANRPSDESSFPASVQAHLLGHPSEFREGHPDVCEGRSRGVPAGLRRPMDDPAQGCREAWRGSLETTVEGRARRTLRPPRRARRRSSRGLRGPPHRRRGGPGRRVSETSVKGCGRPRRVAPPSMSRASGRVVAEGVGVVCGACGEGAGGGCRRGLSGRRKRSCRGWSQGLRGPLGRGCRRSSRPPQEVAPGLVAGSPWGLLGGW